MKKISAKLLRRRNRKKDAETKDKQKSTAPSAGSSVPFSHGILSLSDDVLVIILSFVAYAPYEREAYMAITNCDGFDYEQNTLFHDYVTTIGRGRLGRSSFSKKDKAKRRLFLHAFGTLSHVFPLVCRTFHRLCRTSDLLWSQAINRMARYDEFIGWKKTLVEYASCSHSTDSDEEEESDLEDDHDESDLFGDLSGGRRDDLVASACAKYQSTHDSGDCSSAMQFFQYLADRTSLIVHTGHCFHSKNLAPPRIGGKYTLKIPQEFYTELLDEKSQRLSEKTGDTLKLYSPDVLPRPRFIYSFGVDTPLTPGDPVLISEIVNCRLIRMGNVEITFVPLFHAIIGSRFSGDSSFDWAIARSIPHIQERLGDQSEDRNSSNTLRLPMIRTYSTVAPQLGMEFVIENIIDENNIRMLRALMGDKLSWYLNSGNVIPDTREGPYPLARPILLYTCQPDRVNPLGIAGPGEDAIVLFLRRCFVKPNGAMTISAVPVRLGHIKKDSNDVDSGATDDTTACVSIRVALTGLGPSLVIR